MITKRTIGTMAALGGFAAAVALLAGLPAAKADELADLRANQELLQRRLDQLAQVGAPESKPREGTVTAGSHPRSFIIPGTDTSLRVGGEARLSVDYILSGGGNQINALPTNTLGINGTLERTPLDIHGQFVPGLGKTQTPAVDFQHSRSHFVQTVPRESRIHLEAHTPTAYGLATTIFEFDFNGGAFSSDPAQVANSVVPRLRHAYGTLGGLLVGQTYPFLYDVSAFPDILDFGGDQDTAPSRQPLIRYTGRLPYVANANYAIELVQPDTDVNTAVGKFNALTTAPALTVGTPNPSGGFINPAINPAPDLMVGLELNHPVYHMRFGAIVRDLKLNDGHFFNKEFVGYGGAWTGWVKPGWLGWERDQISWNTVAGEGLGRWISGLDSSGLVTNFGSAAVFPATATTAAGTITAANIGNLRATTAFGFGATLAYEHYWLPNLRSDVDVSIRHFDYNSTLLGATQNTIINKELVIAHANLIWSPVPFADVGIEYLFGHRQVVANLRGDMNAILTRFRVRF